MKTYDCILFDADETLFHFDDFRGLRTMFLQYGIDFTVQHYHNYKMLNKALWGEYQQGKLPAVAVQQRRFQSWADYLNLHPQHLNDVFLDTMADISDPIHGARDLLDHLHGKVKLGIITNGFTSLQDARLERTDFKKYFDLLVISEQVGITKPCRGIFDYALQQMSYTERDKVLMVGDTYETDVIGGISAGIDTCWINWQQKNLSEHDAQPTYHVASLDELTKRVVEAY